MLRYSILLGIATMLAIHPAAAQVAAAQLKGAVLDELGRPLAGARVVYAQKPRILPGKFGKGRSAPVERTLSSKVITDAFGRYEIPQLPSGDYYLCMTAPGYLTNCEWAQWRLATVAQGQVLDHGPVQLPKAAPVTIVINDPLSLLKEVKPPNSPLVVGVRDGFGRLHPARETAVVGNSHMFQVDVPYGTAMNVWLHSWRFFLTDSRGVALDQRGAQVPFQVALNGAAPTFIFNIGGPVKP